MNNLKRFKTLDELAEEAYLEYWKYALKAQTTFSLEDANKARKAWKRFLELYLYDEPKKKEYETIH